MGIEKATSAGMLWLRPPPSKRTVLAASRFMLLKVTAAAAKLLAPPVRQRVCAPNANVAAKFPLMMLSLGSKVIKLTSSPPVLVTEKEPVMDTGASRLLVRICVVPVLVKLSCANWYQPGFVPPEACKVWLASGASNVNEPVEVMRYVRPPPVLVTRLPASVWLNDPRLTCTAGSVVGPSRYMLPLMSRLPLATFWPLVR